MLPTSRKSDTAGPWMWPCCNVKRTLLSCNEGGSASEELDSRQEGLGEGQAL